MWRSGPDRCAYCLFEGETDFEQIGVHLVAMRPGEPMAMYHWESDQEDFLGSPARRPSSSKERSGP